MAERPQFRVSDAFRAAVELGLARLRLDRHQATTEGPDLPVATLDPSQVAIVDRVAFAIPRVAARLPWRADCLVQALAAQRWLARQGVATRLTLGVPKDKRPQFEAHAWLSAGDRIVTGGNISGYVPLHRP